MELVRDQLVASSDHTKLFQTLKDDPHPLQLSLTRFLGECPSRNALLPFSTDSSVVAESLLFGLWLTCCLTQNVTTQLTLQMLPSSVSFPRVVQWKGYIVQMIPVIAQDPFLFRAMHCDVDALALLVARLELNMLHHVNPQTSDVTLLLSVQKSLLPHSCSPNTAIRFVTGEMVCRLLNVLPLKRHEALTISCLSEDELHYPAIVRTRLLRDRFGFDCQCPRCMRELLRLAP